MNTLYIERQGQANHQEDDFTFENYYCAYIVYCVFHFIYILLTLNKYQFNLSCQISIQSCQKKFSSCFGPHQK